jgi:hypothetical protein
MTPAGRRERRGSTSIDVFPDRPGRSWENQPYERVNALVRTGRSTLALLVTSGRTLPGDGTMSIVTVRR